MCTPNALDVIKTTYGIGKKALDIAKQLNNVELKEAILDLKEEIIALREENIALKEQLNQKQRYNMEFIDNYYWDIKEDGTKVGPFCPACWDGDEKAVRMQEGAFGTLCPVCHIKTTKKG